MVTRTLSYELRTVLSGAKGSVADDIEVPSSSQASKQFSSLVTVGAIDGLTCEISFRNQVQKVLYCLLLYSHPEDVVSSI